MPHDSPPILDDESLEAWRERARARGLIAARVLGDKSSKLWRSASVVQPLSWLPPEAFELDLDDPAQRRFGDYELLEKLGQGGMGVVYRARQLSLGREVALKILAAGPWASEEFGVRFQREARHAASLSHPNIVAIHEIARLDDVDFFSMRLVRGASLAERLARHAPMDPRQAAQLMRTVSEALAYAHSLGVLHLDLKPGNVLIETDGQPLVADFGLARGFDDEAGVDPTEVSGTPSYMAPEQVQPGRHQISTATDVWGLGAILYECLTGRPPHHGGNAHATMDAVLSRDVVPPRAIDARIPADLEAVCLHCLARDPARRYATARELADELGRFLEGRPVRVRPRNAAQKLAGWARRQPAVAAASGVAVLALLLGLAATTQQWRRAQAKAEEAQHFARVAQASGNSARIALWTNRLAAAWTQYQAHDGLAALPYLVDNLREQESAGDGDAAAAERLRIGALLHQAPQPFGTIEVGARVTAVALDREDRFVAVGTANGDVLLYELAGRTLRWRTSTLGRGRGAPPEFHRAVRWIGFVPGQDALLVRCESPGIAPRLTGSDMFRIELADGAVSLPPLEGFPALLFASYGPDARQAIGVSRRGADFDAQLLQVGGWQPLGPALGYRRQFRPWLVGPGGTWAATTAVGSPRVELVDPRTMRTHVVLEHESPITAWAFSPDAATLALGHVNGLVRLVEARNGQVRALEPSPDAVVRRLDFSRDGRLLAAAAADASVRVWSLPAGKLHAAPLRLESSGSSVVIDGETRTLVTVRESDGVATLHRLPARGGALAMAVPLTPALHYGEGLASDAFAYAPATGLVASADGKRVRLWRTHRAPLLGALGPPQSSRDVVFDGRHVAAVGDERVEVIDVVERRAVSSPLEHPHPVGLAAMSRDGLTLLAVSGRELHAWDWRRGERRFAPIAIENTPLRLVVGRDVVAVSHGREVDGRYREVVQVFDVATGTARSPAAPVPAIGPLLGLRFSGDGASLLAWTGAVVDVLDAATLQPRLRLVHEADGTVLRDVVSSRDGRTLRSLTATPRRLWHWNLATGARIDRRDVPCGTDATEEIYRWDALGDLALPDADGTRVVLNCTDHGAVLVEADGTTRALAHAPALLTGPEGSANSYAGAAAASADGRLYARAFRNGVIVSDVRTGIAVAPPWAVPLDEGDMLDALVFAPDGARLLAGSRRGRWAAWELPVDRRPLAAIAQDAAMRLPAAMRPDEDDSAAGLGADPGPTPYEHPATRAAARVIGGERVPPREPGTGDTMLDLTDWYDTTLVTPGLEGQEYGGRFNMGRSGVMRLLGTDYDVRGGISLFAGAGSGTRRVAGIPVGDRRIAELRVLTNCAASVAGEPGPSIVVELHYGDGSRAVLPVQFVRDTMCNDLDPADPSAPRVAWGLRPDTFTRLFATRLANPHPERRVRSIALEGGQNRPNLATVYAISLEPPM